jgi:hypothetical protein
MTVGLTVFGIIQRNLLTSKMNDAFAGTGGAPGADGGAFGNTRELLSPEKRAAIPPEVMDKIVDSLSSSISTMFLWALIPAGLALVTVMFMGNSRLIIPGKGQKEKEGKPQPEWSGGH